MNIKELMNVFKHKFFLFVTGLESNIRMLSVNNFGQFAFLEKYTPKSLKMQ